MLVLNIVDQIRSGISYFLIYPDWATRSLKGEPILDRAYNANRNFNMHSINFLLRGYRLIDVTLIVHYYTITGPLQE